MQSKPQPGNLKGWNHPAEFPQLCRYLAELSPQPMVAVEGITHIVRYVNPAFRQLLGKEDPHLLGRAFAEAVPESMANGCLPLLNRVLTTGTPEALAEQEHRASAAAAEQLQGTKPSPTHLSYLAWAILLPVEEDPLKGADEKPVGVMIQVTDATEIAGFRKAAAAINEALLMTGVLQHELMETLSQTELDERQARTEADAANLSKDLFMATLSHELRTPLNAIMGWAEMLNEDGYEKGDWQEGLHVILRCAKVQTQLIEDMLDVSRIISGNLRLEIVPCSLTSITGAVLDIVHPAAAAKEIKLVAKLDPMARPEFYDEARMQQVVLNLLTNAIKFTPENGTVTIRLFREQNAVKLQVSDTGTGMDAELLPLVFDRFRQADSSSRRQFGGLGIGLSIVKHIVDLHGGTVEAQSDGQGTGSTFTVTLPIRAVSDEDGAEPGGP